MNAFPPATRKHGEFLRTLTMGGVLFLTSEILQWAGIHLGGFMLLLLLVANFWHIYDQQFSTRGFHQLLNFTDVRNRVLCDAGVFVICILATIATMILFPDEVGNEDGIDLKGFKLLLSSLAINTGIYAGFRLLTNVGLGILMVAVGGYVFVRG